MTSFHRNKNTGNLVACAHDPCGLHHDDITAENLEEAYRIYDDSNREHAYGYTDTTIIRNPYGDEPISRKGFDEQISNVSDAIDDDDWDVLTESTNDIADIISRNRERIRNLDNRRTTVINDITTYLASDDARPLREYMGEAVDIHEVATLMAHHVPAMTRPDPISRSITRCILSRTGNDMNKKRYIASVLFFGGRCCYCGSIIHKSTGGGTLDDSTATAEHIDPMGGEPHGETKYGNVALCCNKCNHSKGDLSLEDWKRGNTDMNDGQKAMMMSRIKRFRQYTMYTPMSMEKSRMIDRIIERAHNDERKMTTHGDDRDALPRKEHETNEQYMKRNHEFRQENIRKKIKIKKEAITQALMLRP